MLVTVLATMMLPPQVTLIPIYVLWNGLGATNTYLPLVVPAFLGTPFFIFMVRQFLLAVPDELIEAACIDNPLIYLNDSDKYTLSIGLYSFFGQHGVQWGPLMAAFVLFTLPAVIIYIAAQRYLVGGIAAGAVK